jgi:hypothetical protein
LEDHKLEQVGGDFVGGNRKPEDGFFQGWSFFFGFDGFRQTTSLFKIHGFLARSQESCSIQTNTKFMILGIYFPGFYLVVVSLTYISFPLLAMALAAR